MVQFDLKTLGTFAVNRNGEIRLYQPPRSLNNEREIGRLEKWFDLHLGIQNYKHQPTMRNQETMMLFIKTIVREGTVLKKELKADIVCTSELMREMVDQNFTIPIRRKRVIVNGVRRKGIIFLDLESIYRPEKNYRDLQFIYGRLRFDMFMTLDENGKEQNTRRMYGKDESTKSAFRSTISNGTKSINIFHISDVDCVDNEGNFTDFRTRGMVAAQLREGRSLNWFLQSYLSGIKQIAVGIVEHEKFVTEIEMMPLSKLEEEGAESWNRDDCMSYLFDCFDYFQSTLKCDGMAFQFDLNEHTRVPIAAEECQFVPDSFLESYR